MRIEIRLGVALLLAVLLAACHEKVAPDLARLYATGTEQTLTPPVILIPGILGSRLFD